MIKFMAPNGYIAYKVNKAELFRSGYFGNVCDECCHECDSMFLVPVLNHGQCSSCFQDFLQICSKFDDDYVDGEREQGEIFELEYSRFYERVIPVTAVVPFEEVEF